jgi:hypothetical protein
MRKIHLTSESQKSLSGPEPIDKALGVVNPLKVARWDEYVAAHAQASFFHGATWARVLRDTYGHEPCYFTRFSEDRLCTLLPMMEVSRPLAGRSGVSLPFTDECEPITGARTGLELFREAVRYGQARGWRYLEWRGGKDLFEASPASLCFYGHTLDLSPPENRLFEGLHSAVRRAIRRADRSGVEVQIAHTLESMKAYYELHCKTRKKHGILPQPWKFFFNIYQHVLSKGNGFVALATFGQRPIAAAVYFHIAKRAIYKFGASDDEFQHLRANNKVMWEAIRWLAQNGHQSLHFGRTSMANAGLRRFKLSWGTAEYSVEYRKYDLRRREFVREQDKAFGWHNALFARLPLSLARCLGSFLYRHVSCILAWHADCLEGAFRL